MWSGETPGTPATERNDADRLFSERLRLIVWIVLGAIPVYAIADFYFRPPTMGVLQVEKLILGIICILIWRATLRDDLQRFARLMGLILVTAIALVSAASSNLTGQYVTHVFLGVMIALFGATLAPWGVATQLLAVLIVAGSVLWNVRVVTGGFAVLFDYPAVAVAVTWLASIYMAWVLENNRRALAAENFERSRAEAALREEAATSAALARVGEELIAAVNTPALLERLSQLTTELISCDCSWTMLRKPNEEIYVVAAHTGFTAEQAASINLVAIPHDRLAHFLRRLERESVVVIHPGEEELGAPARLAEQYGAQMRMHVALRRGGELIGVHAAAYLRPDLTFTRQQQRLLRGIAHLASLALEAARLVDELDRANRFKSDFVANMSHELRTPLHVIIGYHEMLLDGALGPLTSEQNDTLHRTDAQARELLALINATLDLSRVEAMPVTLDARDVPIAELFRDLERETAATLDGGQLHWQWYVPPAFPSIRTDPVKLRMVLKNLVHNAAKFTPRGSIAVTAQANATGVELRVTDTGVGIAKEMHGRIFEPFFQADGVGQGGAGLGLYIVRRVLDLLGGRISVESELGQGSTFCVWVPFDVPGATVVDQPRGDALTPAASSETRSRRG